MSKFSYKLISTFKNKNILLVEDKTLKNKK